MASAAPNVAPIVSSYSRMAIARAESIPGWMLAPELAWLAEQAARHRIIVEIGSFLGRSTRALADNTPGVVYAIDDWQGPREVYIPVDVQRRFYPRFRTNLADHITQGKVIPILADHGDCSKFPVEFVRGPEHMRPDMVFIDGSHEYGDVKRDILIWQSRLAKGGLICGHDLDRPAVQIALRETTPGYKEVEGTQLWYCE